MAELRYRTIDDAILAPFKPLLSAPHGVELHGLSRADLNGKIGKCVGVAEGGERLLCEAPGFGGPVHPHSAVRDGGMVPSGPCQHNASGGDDPAPFR